MTIRKRLILSYIAMTLIPLILFISIAIVLAAFFLKRCQVLMGTSKQEGKVQTISDTFDNRQQLFLGFNFLSNSDTERLLDNDFLKEMNEQFKEVDAALVIVKDDRITYASPQVESNNLYEQLIRQAKSGKNGWTQKINGQFTVEQHAFTFNDHSPGTLYLLSDFNPFFGKIQKLILILLISLLLIIGLTNGLMTYLVSRSIIKPLNTLKQAAEQIKEGNLDQKLILSRQDEIGEVGEAFEEMRERLKQSIQLQLQYEENRKELISNISHDLKTPITGVKACIEGLRDGIADTEEKRNKYIRMMDTKITDLDHMIDELFLFSKLDLKRLPFHFEQVDITAFLRTYFLELRADPQLKDITIDFHDGDSKSIYVWADYEKIQRIVQNIVSNCLKYMDGQDRKIDIQLEGGEKEVTISIQDEWSGHRCWNRCHIFLNGFTEWNLHVIH